MDDLGAAAWNSLGPPQTATPPTVTITDSLEGQAQRFYRVLLLQ